MKNIFSLLLILIGLFQTGWAQMVMKPVSIHPWVNGYWQYTPPTWDKTTKLPLVVYFHGLGDTYPKKSLQQYSDIALPLKIKQSGMPHECIVFMPQLNRDWAGGGTIQNIIDWAIKNYPVDTNRVYLTGLSMGGGSIMDWAEQGRVSSVAAMLPICPASWFTTRYSQPYIDNNIPIRFYHAADDKVVDPSSSKSWMDGLNNLGITPRVERVLYPTGGHNIWSTVYEDNEAWTWLFKQIKAKPRTIEAEFFFPGGKYVLYSDKTWSK
jgi:predicted peptidase